MNFAPAGKRCKATEVSTGDSSMAKLPARLVGVGWGVEFVSSAVSGDRATPALAAQRGKGGVIVQLKRGLPRAGTICTGNGARLA